MSSGRGPFRPHDEHLDEGDILTGIPFVKWENGEPGRGGGARGVVTSNGCACEDYDRAVEAGRTQAAAKLMIQVAPLRPTAGTPAQRLEEIRSGQHLDFFYIFGEPLVLPDHIADLTREQPIPASILVDCTKIARLATWQWRRLLIHLAVSRFHEQPEALFRSELLNHNEDPQ